MANNDDDDERLQGEGLLDCWHCISAGIGCMLGAGHGNVCIACKRLKVRCKHGEQPINPGSPSRPMKKAQVAMTKSLDVSRDGEMVVAVRDAGAQVREGMAKIAQAMERQGSEISRALERQSSMLCEVLAAIGQQGERWARRMEGKSGRRLVRGQVAEEVEKVEEIEETTMAAKVAEMAGTGRKEEGGDEDGALGVDTPGAGLPGIVILS